jgi:hypothetical protein
MITELKEVIQKVEQLDEQRKRIIAKMLEDELKWDNTLRNTQGKLAQLAKEALKEYQSDKTKLEDWWVKSVTTERFGKAMSIHFLQKTSTQSLL